MFHRRGRAHRHRPAGLAVLALVACLAPARAQEDGGTEWIGVAPPSPEALAADPEAFEGLLTDNGLALDVAGRAVSARGGTLHDRSTLAYPIEYVLVTERGRTHEALFLLKAQPSLLDACLRAIGLSPGTPMRFRPKIPPPTDAEMDAGASPWDPVPSSGPLVDISVAWTDDGGVPHRRSLESMLIDVRSGQSLSERDWVYTGSRFGKMRQGKKVVRAFVADLQGDIVALYLTGEGSCLLERNSLDGLDDTLYTINADGMPARGTPITVTFTPTGQSVAPARPPGDAEVLDGEVARRVDEFVARFVPEGFAGVVLVDVGGEVVLHKAYGLADRAARVPVTTATAFPLGALGRVFVATAILQLEAAGKLKRGDLIARHLPDVPDGKNGIRVADLLGHTSGLSASGAADTADREAALKALLAGPVAAAGDKPGQDRSAEDALLIAIIENASGERWSDYLAEHIFGPAGMTQSGLCGDTRWDRSQLAHGYDGDAPGAEAQDLGTPALAPPTWLGLGRGAVVAPVGDLYRWERAVRAGGLLPAELSAELLDPAAGADELAFRADASGLRFLAGNSPGFASAYSRFADTPLTVIVASDAFNPYVTAMVGSVAHGDVPAETKGPDDR